MIKVNIGREPSLSGWVNVVWRPSAHSLETQAPPWSLPAPTGSAECVLIEWVFERLHPRREAVGTLQEALRVLAPGGVLRVVTLDLDKVMEAYRNDALRQFGAARWPGWYSDASPCIQLSAHLFGTGDGPTYGGALVVYNVAGLIRSLGAAGFVSVRRERPNESRCEVIRREIRDRWTDTSLIVEGLRP